MLLLVMLCLAHKIPDRLTQQGNTRNKLYALHTPEVECISKVRREVAHIIVSPAHNVGDETGRSVGRIVPVHALPATAACEDMDLLLLKAQPAYQSNGPRLPNLRGSLQALPNLDSV